MFSSQGVSSSSAGSTTTLYIDKTDDNYGLGENITFHADAEDNIALGEDALNSTTGAGLRNIGIGTNALTAITVGDDNIAIGTDAGLKLMQNGSNIVIGSYALDAADGDENGNVVIGYGAMTSVNNDASDRNVAIGYSSLAGATTDGIADCVSIGNLAMGTGVSTEDGTVAIGSSALAALTSGAGNTAVGYQSLLTNTIGERNTVLGYGAMDDTDDVFTDATCDYDDATTITHDDDGGDIKVGMSVTGTGIPANAYVDSVTSVTEFELSASTTDGAVTDGTLTFSGSLASDDNVFIGYASGGGTWGAEGISSQNVAIGSKTMDANLDGANKNVAVGHQSLTDLTSGIYNTCLGARAGTNLTTGGINVAVGSDSLYSSTDVDKCVFIGGDSGQGVLTSAADGTVGIGYSALNALTTGAQNTAIGYNAMFDVVEGGNNTAIGYGAFGGALDATADASADNTFVGYLAGSGDWVTAVSLKNTAIGSYAMSGNMNGGLENTAVGYSSLSNLTTGDRNVAVGLQSLLQLQMGERNVAMGYNAMNVAVGDGHCVAIGYNALVAATYASATATLNTAVGYSAGSTITTGQNNTFLGANSDPSAVGASNQTVVGYATTGVADDSVTLGNDDVDAVYMASDGGAVISAGGVGIGLGTSVTSYPLSIQGPVTDGGIIANFDGSDVNQGFLIQNYLCGGDEDRVGVMWENQGVTNTRMWCDDTGDIRVNNANPAGHDSGTVVGTQTFTGTHVYKTDATDLIIGQAVRLVGRKLFKTTTANDKLCVGIYAGQSGKIVDSFEQACNETDGFGHAVVSLGDTMAHLNDNEVIGVLVDGAVEAGDLLCTSSTAGLLTVQEDDIIRSYTVGKAMEDGSEAAPVYAYIYCG